jgi:hypothetical protein
MVIGRLPISSIPVRAVGILVQAGRPSVRTEIEFIGGPLTGQVQDRIPKNPGGDRPARAIRLAGAGAFMLDQRDPLVQPGGGEGSALPRRIASDNDKIVAHGN